MFDKHRQLPSTQWTPDSGTRWWQELYIDHLTKIKLLHEILIIQIYNNRNIHCDRTVICWPGEQDSKANFYQVSDLD